MKNRSFDLFVLTIAKVIWAVNNNEDLTRVLTDVKSFYEGHSCKKSEKWLLYYHLNKKYTGK